MRPAAGARAWSCPASALAGLRADAPRDASRGGRRGTRPVAARVRVLSPEHTRTCCCCVSSGHPPAWPSGAAACPVCALYSLLWSSASNPLARLCNSETRRAASEEGLAAATAWSSCPQGAQGIWRLAWVLGAGANPSGPALRMHAPLQYHGARSTPRGHSCAFPCLDNMRYACFRLAVRPPHSVRAPIVRRAVREVAGSGSRRRGGRAAGRAPSRLFLRPAVAQYRFRTRSNRSLRPHAFRLPQRALLTAHIVWGCVLRP
jgi:hypothetical protein